MLQLATNLHDAKLRPPIPELRGKRAIKCVGAWPRETVGLLPSADIRPDMNLGREALALVDGNLCGIWGLEDTT